MIMNVPRMLPKGHIAGRDPEIAFSLRVRAPM